MSEPVALLDLQAQYRPLREQFLDVIARVCDSQRCIMGDEVVALEKELADYLEVKHALGVSSGTDALLVAMMAAGVGHGDEVITPTFSFFATAGCVARLGARPVLVDSDPKTYNLDIEAVKRAITPKTKAILPVHLFGQAVDMTALAAAAGRVPLIEDAAQAIGTRDGKKRVGGLGLAGCFSFYPTKNLGAFGDAGLVTTNDDAFAQTMRLLRDHGMSPRYYHAIIGGNFRLDAIQGAVLRVKLPHLDAWHEGRRTNAARYRKLFADANLLDTVHLPYERPDGSYHIYNQFVVEVPQRDALRQYLTEQKIGTEIYYPVPFHRQECFKYLGYKDGDFPVAEAAAARVLALPVYPELPEAHQARVVEAIGRFYGR
jgi:dTDP-4-amino-4,6-dideoxygalactose transaminase